MRLNVFLAALLLPLFLALTGPATAQTGDRVWVQIEAQPTLNEARLRARAWAAMFPDVAGFRMASGWYAVSLGPYTREAAEARLGALRRDNLIPGDSFIAFGEIYRAPFWPAAANPAEAPVQGLAAPAPVEVAPLPPAGTETVAAPSAPLPAEETVAEARAAEQGLSAEERRAIQSALQWAGFYTSAIDGAFGPGTRGSITAWQSSRGYDPTGFLTRRQRDRLLDERRSTEAALGLETITEPEAGIEIAMPLAHVAFDGYAPPFVQYVERNDSGMRALLISQPGDVASLRGLYDLLQTLDTVPPLGERALSDRSFSIEARNDRLESRTYAELSNGMIKGYMLVWEPKAAETAQKALPLMKASFRAIGGRALDPNLVPLDEGLRAGMLTGMEVRKPALSRSGFYVGGRGEVVTTAAAVAQCSRITLDGTTEAAVRFADAALDVALLVPARPLAPRAVARLDPGTLRAGTEVALSGYPYEDALPAPVLTWGTLSGVTGLDGEGDLRRLTLAPRPGDAGGPVLDATGAVIGMLLPADVGGPRTLPDGVAFARSAEALAARLAAAGLTLPAPGPAPQALLSPDEMLARAHALTVLVSCWD